MIFGCENGALMFHGDEFVAFTAPDEYGRMGNAFVSETSPIVVGDYKNDPDAEGYLLNAVTLIDTAAQTFEVVDLPDEVQYTFRDIAYVTEPAANSVHAVDLTTGDVVATVELDHTPNELAIAIG